MKVFFLFNIILILLRWFDENFLKKDSLLDLYAYPGFVGIQQGI
ncbi:hypothetical protein ADU37_CDS01730 [Thermococcus sp. 2319x1]|nr:hypothetical protein ADU37_CDS01730 [Thermococcus sp. 2319x1]